MLLSRNSLIASTVAVFCFQASQAHVSLTPKYAEPGQTNFKAAFHVGHGCDGSNTIGLQVTVPQEVTKVTPQEVSDWTLSTTYRDTENTIVDTITWSGNLPATDSVEFDIVFDIPNEDLSSKPNATLHFPVIQECEVGSAEHTTTNGSSVGETAPSIVIVKDAAAATAASTGTHTHSHETNTSGANAVLTSLLPLAAAFAAAYVNF